MFSAFCIVYFLLNAFVAHKVHGNGACAAVRTDYWTDFKQPYVGFGVYRF